MYIMKSMRVAEARARFGELLDEAEQGNTVIVERGGVRFRIVADRPDAGGRSDDPLFEFVDASVLDGAWTWKAGAKGLKFTVRRKRR